MSISESSNQELSIEEKELIGWIPTVLGNLSFRLIGHSGYPYRFHKTIQENEFLSIYCLQKRIPFDLQIPLPLLSNHIFLWLSSFLAAKIKKENIESCFILICKGEKEPTKGTVQNLVGTVYRIFQKDISIQRNHFEKLSRAIDNLEKHTGNGTILEIGIEKSLTIEEYAEKYFFINCKININRQGICILDNITSSKELSEDDKLDQANQIFFFLKDAFHSHKHHHHTEETLVSVHPRKDDIWWFEKIAKEFYHYLIHRRDVLTKNSLGIFCYIRTFKEISLEWYEKHNSSSSNDPNGCLCYIDTKEKEKESTLLHRTKSLIDLENSIKISIEHKEKVQKYWIWVMGFALALLAIIVKILDDVYKDNIKNFVEQYPHWLFAILVVFSFFVFRIIQGIDPLNAGTNRRSGRALFTLLAAGTKDKMWAVFWMIASCLITVGIGFALLWLDP